VIAIDATVPRDGLRRFQRQTVERVWASVFDGRGTGRFLVADEVGLGKTRVAAALIRRLQRAGGAHNRGVTVFYFAPNADIAHQNLRILRPRVSAREPHQRLTLLPLFESELRKPGVHVLGFTPSTSLAVLRGTGTAKERALLLALLRPIWRFHATFPVIEVFRDRSGPGPFSDCLAELHANVTGSKIAAEFGRELRKRPELEHRFRELRARAADGELSRSDSKKCRQLISELRLVLARACLRGLDVGLVILDEFHRYPEVLRNAGAPTTLEHAMLDGTPTLLLSATPYRMSADELESDTHVELAQLLEFLLGADVARLAEHELGELRSSFRRLRPAEDPAHRESVNRARTAKQLVEQRLAPVMSRWPRPADQTKTEVQLLMPHINEVAAYVSFQRIVNIAANVTNLRHRATVEYWKSAPYLMSFMRGYRISQAVEQARKRPESRRAIHQALRGSVGTVLSLRDVEAYRPVPQANARFRTLEQLSLDHDQWRALWVPPTLPPYRLDGRFARAADQGATKTLVFSAWRVVPTAVSAIAGYEAERRSSAGQRNRRKDRARRNAAQLLSLRQRRVARSAGANSTSIDRMSVLALVYPSLALAELFDPYELARARGALPSRREVMYRCKRMLGAATAALREFEHEPQSDRRWYWAAPMLLDAVRGVDVERLLGARDGLRSVWQQGEDQAAAVTVALTVAQRVVSGRTRLGRMPHDLRDVLTQLTVAGPAVTALRALRAKGFDDRAQLAAAQIGWGLRTLLNRADATLVIRAAKRSRTPNAYWRQVLDYCAEGALQGVMDEYLHLLVDEHSRPGLEPGTLVMNVARAFCDTTNLQPLAIRADQPTGGTERASVRSRRLTSRFAVAFGAAQTEDENAIHPEIVRQAFNSPFWPWVLVTTSVGQEGLDFHRYCQNLVHWNVPATPVELEQREGRVLRFFNHAVRRNLAQHHAADGLAGRDRWKSMVDAAQARVERADGDHDGFEPEWHYDGDHSVRRIAPILAYSRDHQRFLRVERARIYYRLVLGQPNPQELVEAVMAAIPIQTAKELLDDGLALDLRPKLDVPASLPISH
jgi:hypothetical protein